MQEQVQQEIDTNPGLEKDLTRSDRMARSKAARVRRKELKIVRETVMENAYAKARRARKNSK